MIFKFPKKKVVLDCFISSEVTMRTAPILPAMKHIPDWWKELPNTYVEDEGFTKNATVRKCNGIIDYYKSSVAIPLWSDLNIDVEGQVYRWQFSDGINTAKVHNVKKQATGFLHNHGHLKLINPWVFKTKQDINWVWSQPTYSFTEGNVGLKVVPGVINFHRQHGANVNMMFSLGEKKLYELEHGQVLAHLTPMFDGKIEVVRHLVSEKEMRRLHDFSTPTTFIEKYSKMWEKRKQFSGCPFHNKVGK
jgi:hypothetical protein